LGEGGLVACKKGGGWDMCLCTGGGEWRVFASTFSFGGKVDLLLVGGGIRLFEREAGFRIKEDPNYFSRKKKGEQ